MSDKISIYLRSNAEGVISISIDIPIGLVQSMKTKSVAEPTEVLMSQLAENWMSSETIQQQLGGFYYDEL